MFRKLIRKPNSLKFQKYECRVNTILILWAINQSECSVLSAPNSQPPFLANTLDNTIQRSIKSFKLTNQLSAITISRRYVSFAKQLRQRRSFCRFPGMSRSIAFLQTAVSYGGWHTRTKGTSASTLRRNWWYIIRQKKTKVVLLGKRSYTYLGIHTRFTSYSKTRPENNLNLILNKYYVK